jgi:hypothetical protein
MTGGLRGRLGTLAARLPERLRMALNPAAFGYRWDEIPPPTPAPDARVRLLIGPVNYAGQAWQWARAVSRHPDVGAVNLSLDSANTYGFPNDVVLDERVYWRSDSWGRRQLAGVAAAFTHVLHEAEKPLFGRACGFDVRAEAARLRAAGVGVGVVSHGTDLRSPARHRTIDRWSPFADQADPWVQELERLTAANARLIEDLDAPVFVSTPDLLLDAPGATWLPIVTDPDRWSAGEPLQGDRDRVRVTHAPSSARIKGSELIAPTLDRLDGQGVLSYAPVSGVPAERMPEVYAGVDVVLEQFRIGTYSVVAIEAMAAGRVVVAHVHDQVREHVRRATGWELPVIQATPDTLEEVLRDIVARPDTYRDRARLGPAFVRAVHDGRRTIGALAEFLGVEPGDVAGSARGDDERAP